MISIKYMVPANNNENVSLTKLQFSLSAVIVVEMHTPVQGNCKTVQIKVH